MVVFRRGTDVRERAIVWGGQMSGILLDATAGQSDVQINDEPFVVRLSVTSTVLRDSRNSSRASSQHRIQLFKKIKLLKGKRSKMGT